MNLLPFIFVVLLLFSYSSTILLQQHRIASQMQKFHLGLRRAERGALQKGALRYWNKLEGEAVEKEKVATTPSKEKESDPIDTEEQDPFATPNPHCARLNLFPLIQDGPEAHPQLYGLAIELLQLFYKERLLKEEIEASTLLQSILSAAKENLQEARRVPLETLSLGNEKRQRLYYFLLKGTSYSNLLQGKGTPPLIDFFKIEREPSLVCLFHAHPHMLAVFFSQENTTKLYEALHTGHPPPVMEVEQISQIVGDPQLLTLDKERWSWIHLKRPKHHKPKGEVLFAQDEDTSILVRKEH